MLSSDATSKCSRHENPQVPSRGTRHPSLKKAAYESRDQSPRDLAPVGRTATSLCLCVCVLQVLLAIIQLRPRHRMIRVKPREKITLRSSPCIQDRGHWVYRNCCRTWLVSCARPAEKFGKLLKGERKVFHSLLSGYKNICRLWGYKYLGSNPIMAKSSGRHQSRAGILPHTFCAFLFFFCCKKELRPPLSDGFFDFSLLSPPLHS